MRRVVILRPEPGASATFARAAELGLAPVKLPLFEIEPLAWSPPADLSQFDGLLITSANSIREAGDDLGGLRSLPVYAVGAASGEAARQAGFEIAATGSAGVESLLRSIAPGLRLLHLAGEDRIAPGQVEQSITAVPVYRARPTDGVEADLSDDVVALVHSPRAGARLAELAGDRSRIAIAAISGAAAEACGAGWHAVAVAAQPNDGALLALATRLCEKTEE